MDDEDASAVAAATAAAAGFLDASSSSSVVDGGRFQNPPETVTSSPPSVAWAGTSVEFSSDLGGGLGCVSHESCFELMGVSMTLSNGFGSQTSLATEAANPMNCPSEPDCAWQILVVAALGFDVSSEVCMFSVAFIMP